MLSTKIIAQLQAHVTNPSTEAMKNFVRGCDNNKLAQDLENAKHEMDSTALAKRESLSTFATLRNA